MEQLFFPGFIALDRNQRQCRHFINGQDLKIFRSAAAYTQATMPGYQLSQGRLYLCRPYLCRRPYQDRLIEPLHLARML